MSKFTLNGRPHECSTDKLTYEQIVNLILADDELFDGDTPPNAIPLLTITYHKRTGGDGSRSGIVAPGQGVSDLEGMHINACDTGNA